MSLQNPVPTSSNESFIASYRFVKYFNQEVSYSYILGILMDFHDERNIMTKLLTLFYLELRQPEINIWNTKLVLTMCKRSYLKENTMHKH
jgi:hypothetical protein